MAPESLHKPRDDNADQMDGLLAGLWQEAPFARLPANAPKELREYVLEIEDPRRVYAVHRAKRRHDFQDLVDKYIIQLRYGCGNSDCTTPTCFTCRKRLAGKSPIRRYNPTSARTLAVYLASRDDPDGGICPYLTRSREAPDAVNSLIFTALPRSPPHTSRSRSQGSSTSATSSRSGGKNTGSDGLKTSVPTPNRSRQLFLDRPDELGYQKPERSGCRGPESDSTSPAAADVTVTERVASRDYRSFSATAFGTAAFKMLGWLTPQGVESIVSRISELDLQRLSYNQKSESMEDASKTNFNATLDDSSSAHARLDHMGKSALECDDNSLPEPSPSDTLSCSKGAARPRRSSKATFRTNTSSKTSRRASLEPLSPTTKAEPKSEPRSPRMTNFPHDKLLRPPKSTAAILGRGIPEIPSKPAFFDNVFVSPPAAARTVEPRSTNQDYAHGAVSHKGNSKHQLRGQGESEIRAISTTTPVEPAVSVMNFPLPQTLKRLNVEIVDFICDTLQEDGTFEKSFAEAYPPHPWPQNRQSRLARRCYAGSESISKAHWKAFNEQAIFSVLSDPRSLMASFTKDDKLYDSHTLWYCMLRMTRVTPSLVFHSLWLAAESLFSLARSPHRNYSHSRRSRCDEKPLSDSEVGCAMSICLHALVAAASLATDSRTLYEMSRIRSNGLTLAGTGAAKQPPSLCLQYDDIFSNDLAMRLARRLFRAIAAHRYFVEIQKPNKERNAKKQEVGILRPLLSQLDVMSPDSIRILEFAEVERLLHETRVPTLLLDWARAILLHEWDGRPEFSNDGPFSGALSLISSMYHNRNVLLLGDIQFRIDYFSERLDTVETPVAWLSYTSTRDSRHILDYPYIFNPETLVSFFRAINFSRMSRMYEESSSLKTRMSAIVDPGSLITNPHHKVVLQDMLKKASSKYLVLQISRANVLGDAFDQLWRREKREILRPLKVHLGEEGGEEGFDSGGVQQEFFRMAIAECLDQRHGLFTVDDRTRMAWFLPGSIVEDWKFELMGLLVSLAVYNGLTLPVTFPRALYRKLLGEPVEDLHHIADGWPDLASGLTTLLEWDEKEGLVEDIFARTYEFSVSSFGSHVTRQMSAKDNSWPQGVPGAPSTPAEEDEVEAPLVTSDNRYQYISDYIRYLTDVSVRPQYLAFERGFRACLEPKSLNLLNPSILQSVVEGVQDIDISELRRYARYVGYDASHHTVKDFWSIVKRYDDRMRRKLLEFVTASDRVPVGGMRNLQFVIQKNGEEDGAGGHLPTAYTCYGTLLLPEYKDKEVLRERLGMALENAQGFGFA